jgi:hypothetical protein
LHRGSAIASDVAPDIVNAKQCHVWVGSMAELRLKISVRSRACRNDRQLRTEPKKYF